MNRPIYNRLNIFAFRPLHPCSWSREWAVRMSMSGTRSFTLLYMACSEFIRYPTNSNFKKILSKFAFSPQSIPYPKNFTKLEREGGVPLILKYTSPESSPPHTIFEVKIKNIYSFFSKKRFFTVTIVFILSI